MAQPSFIITPEWKDRTVQMVQEINQRPAPPTRSVSPVTQVNSIVGLSREHGRNYHVSAHNEARYKFAPGIFDRRLRVRR